MKSAVDPFFGTNSEPVTAGRNAAVVAASATDLPFVTSSLLIAGGATAGTVAVILANDPDSQLIALPVAVNQPLTQYQMQVRAVTANSVAGISVFALWSRGRFMNRAIGRAKGGRHRGFSWLDGGRFPSEPRGSSDGFHPCETWRPARRCSRLEAGRFFRLRARCPRRQLASSQRRARMYGGRCEH
jgi:hypothetical protein